MNFINSRRPWFWLLLGVLVKGLPFLFLLHNRPPSDIPGIWGATSVDTHSYIDPIDNLLLNGNYLPDYRMPGYGFIYFLFRLVFSKVVACNILIILQFVLAGISVYYLALTAKFVFNSNKIFYVCFFLFLLSTYSNFFDGWLLTESFCNSALIFAVWFFVKFYKDGGIKNLLYSGIFLTWAIFLRPVFTPLIFVFLFVLMFQITRHQSAKALNNTKNLVGFGVLEIWWQGKFKILMVFLFPFLLADGAWITHNYITHHRIIPLISAGFSPRAANYYEPALFQFIHSWGGSADNTDNNSPVLWFGFHLNGMPDVKEYHVSLPEYIYTSQFNKDSLVKVRIKIIALNDSLLSPAKKYAYQNEVKEKLDRYKLSVKKEKPVLYYIEAPFFHCLPRFLFGPESKVYMKRLQVPGRLGLITESIFTLYYYLVIVLGFAGMFLLFFRMRKNLLALIIAVIPFYTIMFHAVFLRATYNRFLIPAWAFLIVCAAYSIVKISRDDS